MNLGVLNITKGKEKQFNKKRIETVEDLVYFFPRKYYDFTKETGIMPENEISCIVVKIHDVRSYKNKTPMIMAMGNEKNTGKRINIMWFRQEFLFHSIYSTRGKDVFVCGKMTYNKDYDSYSIAGPLLFSSNIKDNMKIYPVYSKITGMSDDYLKGKIKEALALSGEYDDKIPEEINEENCLLSYDKAIKELHQPSNMINLRRAQEKMTFDDLLYFTAKMEMNKRLTPKGNSHILYSMELFNKVKEALPYQLSKGQDEVITSIIKDFKNGKNVRALLSSEVGSGKTTVALLISCALACTTPEKDGYQVAWLVPNKSLAIQHANEIRSYVEPFGYEVACLAGNLKKKEKDEMQEKIKEGKVKFIIGTHSILNDNLEFKDLALIVIDEEHKFGVLQREGLLKKSNNSAHLLTMSGTPIPRTLGLIVANNGTKLYTMSKPEGRIPVKTLLTNDRRKAFGKIKEEIKKHHKVYVVCPMITESNSESMEGVMSIDEIVKIYSNELSSEGVKIAALTGKNKPDEAANIIDDFKNGDTDILCATSVIEVGINVPEASVIVIENAERFGASSLHQLRGRIGRKAGLQGYCVLVSNDLENERLVAVSEINDGFKLSEIDMKLRKTGDWLGITNEQSGENKYVNLMLDNPHIYNYLKEYVPELIDNGDISEFIKERDEATKRDSN